MVSRRPDTQEEFSWWLQELEHSDALSDEALANRYLAIRAQDTQRHGLSRRLMQREAIEHLMAFRFLNAYAKKEAAPGEGRPRLAKVLPR